VPRPAALITFSLIPKALSPKANIKLDEHNEWCDNDNYNQHHFRFNAFLTAPQANPPCLLKHQGIALI
jgi:hypothetical protein